MPQSHQGTVVGERGMIKVIVTVCDELGILLPLKVVALKMGTRSATTFSQLLTSK